MFILFGENKLLEILEGYFCDIWENIIMFGGGVSIGFSIGILYSEVNGFVGFLVKLNVLFVIFVFGFFIVVYVVIKELDKLYDEKVLFLECK